MRFESSSIGYGPILAANIKDNVEAGSCPTNKTRLLWLAYRLAVANAMEVLPVLPLPKNL